MTGLNRLLLALALALLTAVATGQENPGKHDETQVSKNFSKSDYSPYVGRNFPTRVFFGDTHLHTSASGDAFGFGNKLSDEEAYRFARGQTVRSATGVRVRLSRPLDFLVVADHSEAFGSLFEVYRGNPNLMTDPKVRRWHQMLNAGGKEPFKATMEMINAVSSGTFPKILLGKKLFGSLWRKHLAVTDRYNEPGRFTAFHGYEWSSMPGGNNLHRVVIYRDGADIVGRAIPFTSIDSDDPEDLWRALAAYEEQTGGAVLAIPHNGNVSNGTMFAMETRKEQPLTLAYARTRMRWEPLYEVTQIKGDGEAHPFLSPNDEFADYETWDKGNLNLSKLKKNSMLAGEYARSALKRGLALHSKLGANPYKFGLIGSTDSHTSLATSAEENFFGKHSGSEPSAGRWSHPVFNINGVKIMGWQQAASGYAAVWASENTREAIFDAMQRKETYATTGPRMTVRFFGGWDFVAADAETRLPANVGYSKGVPMGGDLTKAPAGKSPSFLVAALRDYMSGNLDRIQIIKGWLDSSGKTHEKVYDVVWSDERQRNANGKLPPVGNTVDIPNATWKNSIGSPELIAVWNDPDFDPAQKAFYYARVLEIPTPRWTAYDAKRYGVKMPKEVPMITQERAYTSPIWYTPGN